MMGGPLVSATETRYHSSVWCGTRWRENRDQDRERTPAIDAVLDGWEGCANCGTPQSEEVVRGALADGAEAAGALAAALGGDP